MIDGATNALTAAIPVSADGYNLAAYPATDTVYVGAGNAVAVINGTTNQVTAGYFDIFGLAGERAWTYAEGRTWRMSWLRAQMRAVRHCRPWPRSWAATRDGVGLP